MSVVLPTTLTLVNDGDTNWAADTAELAKALPKYYTLDWSFGRSYAVIEPIAESFDGVRDPGVDAYSFLCSVISAAVDNDEIDLDTIESRMCYQPATSQRGFVLYGAIRQAAIEAFAALESEGVQNALRLEGSL